MRLTAVGTSLSSLPLLLVLVLRVRRNLLLQCLSQLTSRCCLLFLLVLLFLMKQRHRNLLRTAL
jgi:hypothetical protein